MCVLWWSYFSVPARHLNIAKRQNQARLCVSAKEQLCVYLVKYWKATHQNVTLVYSLKNFFLFFPFFHNLSFFPYNHQIQSCGMPTVLENADLGLLEL